MVAEYVKKIFNRPINSITLAAVLVATSSLLSRVLGIIRDRILAGRFGASGTLDIYYSAFRIPDLIFNLLILGALSAGFIPIFTSLIRKSANEDGSSTKGEENNEAWELANNVLNVLLIILAFLSVLGIIFAPALMKLIAPGFSAEARDQAVQLTRIMFLSPIFLGVSSIFGGVLQSFKNFFIYSLSPILYNVGIILGVIFLYPLFGIKGLAMGVVLGTIMHMLVQLPSVRALGFRFKLFSFSLRDRNLLRIGRMMIPRTLSLAISQIDLVVTTIIASTLASGSLTVFNFANNLQSFPIGIFGVSFAVAAFPILSQFAFDNKKLVESFSSTMRQILFFIIPSTVILITLRAQIVRVILGTGSFSWNDTVLTMQTLAFFSLSLFAQASIPLLTRVFYARHDSRTPFSVGMFTVLLNIFLSIYLSRKMGVAGLALAYSLSNILNFAFLWLALHSKIGDLDQLRILTSTIKFSLAGLACGFTIQAAKNIATLPFVDMDRFYGVFIQSLVSVSLGLGAYFFICWVLKSEELSDFWTALRRRLPRRKVKIDDPGEARGI